VTGAGWVEVWRDDEGRWRWRYREGEGGDLLGNESHPTRIQAVRAAAVAYPEVPIQILVQQESSRRARGGVSAALGWLALFMLAVVAAIPIGIGLLARRLARLLRR
jgi:hypothetical protein